jgi:hypothetical protein
VPSCPPVEDDYFDDALFIGDSRMMGLMLYSGLTTATFYTEKGINVLNLLTKDIVPLTGGGHMTIPEALRGKNFAKIYIKLGLNELGWPSARHFAEEYGKVIDKIRSQQPEAVYYVLSILPVSKDKSTKDKIFTNERIGMFNEEIKRMTWEKGVYYLDAAAGMAGDDGALPADASRDGIHLNKDYCVSWLDYLRSHIADGDG